MEKTCYEYYECTKGSKALDVCCGTADWTIALSEAVGSKGQVTGLDFSENMLEVGKQKTASLENIQLVHGDAMNLPLMITHLIMLLLVLAYAMFGLFVSTQRNASSFKTRRHGGMS